MMRIAAITLAVFLGLGVCQANAASVTQNVGVCNPANPANCIKPNADGSINTSGGSGTAAVATAADPSYMEGATVNLSTNLSGYLRSLNKAAASAFADGWDITQGATTDAAAATAGTNCSLIACQKAIRDAAVSVAAVPISGAVTISAETPGAGAANLGKQQNSAASTGDTGVMMICRRTDAPANQATSNGNYEVVECSAGRLWVASGGDVASAVADSGNPVKVGGKYNTTSVAAANGNRVDAQSEANGSLLIQPHAVSGLRWKYTAVTGGISNTTTAVTIHASCGAGLKNYLTSFQLQSDALGAATEIAFRDGAAGTPVWLGKITTAGVISGFDTIIEDPIPGTAATLLEFVTLTASITGAVYINAQGYCAP